ncbi:sterol desaturase family protein [Echinicola jeungdonensis]|uniref:Sterol desaturase family protein n=1 Tax=Echinicola jeungdonensis TaxID=709343 RepID=A0ABV5J2I7_9BACT|nr:sterol desaturase family protein [Echinicola jeungdonensis]MDN3667759.1 sterol desaturase family protein [Echinicola jeungdonensis]MDN3671204.1 sterol desaturase family protein [Echinicola jeungdonensis]
MENIIAFLIGVGIAFMRYFVVAGVSFLIFYKFYFYKYFKAKIQKRLANGKDFKREIFHSLVSNIIFVLAAIIIIRGPWVEYTKIYRDITAYPLWWMPISLILSLFIHDTYFYWLHRIYHLPLFFKTIHWVHHKSISPTPWASYSFHFWEAFTLVFFIPILVLSVPIHPLMFLTFNFCTFTINVYGHLGFEIMPKWFRNSWLFEVINSSVYHNLHHSNFKGNYGLYFRIWDRLMGTEHSDYVKIYDSIQKRRFGEKIKMAH